MLDQAGLGLNRLKQAGIGQNKLENVGLDWNRLEVEGESAGAGGKGEGEECQDYMSAVVHCTVTKQLTCRGQCQVKCSNIHTL